MTANREVALPNRIYQAEVRDTYDLGDTLPLMVDTNRNSVFWFEMSNDIVSKSTMP